MATIRKPNPLNRLKNVKTPRSRGGANSRTCPNPSCGATGDKITDDADKRVCTECGTVLSDSNIVSEVQFGETSSGAAVVQGSYIGADQTHARSLGTAFKRAGGMERKRYINQLSAALNIAAATADQAFRHYKLAAAANFIQGRRTRNVAAVCLYIACRKDPHSPFMLIDFSDVLHINVFKLGATYLDLVQQVPVKYIPPVIPENLIHRFAARLEFGDKMNKVANDAIRLVQRMNRDWMVSGRRPSGICGACLILAARMNNFRRTVREVVYVVKVTDVTIQKRLDEFKVTESSSLTVDQFRSIWLEKAHDPPAFYEQKSKKRKRVRKVDENGEVIPDEDGEEENREGSVERATSVVQEPRVDKDGFAVPSIPIDPRLLAATSSALDALNNSPLSPPDSNRQSTERDDSTSPRPTKRQCTDSTRESAEETIEQIIQRSTEQIIEQSTDKVIEEVIGVSIEQGDIGDDAEQGSGRRRNGRAKAPAKGRSKVPVVTQAELAVENEVEQDMLSYLNDPAINEAALQIAAATAATMKPDARIPMTEDVPEEEFADDPEVVNCLLTPEEVDFKERVWIHEFKDYLREQQNKRFRKEIEEANRGGAAKVVRRRKRKGRIGEGGDGTPAATPAESTKAMLRRRGFSKKINYAAIDALFEKDSNGSPAAESEPMPIILP
ncbi:MAG: transcription factor TFIIIB subunit brf1 [Geoglossum umbratile]|nr:MAG: transcription factor TFIIIB subunit brf1 [Geoglossum umbratile]